MAELKCPTKEKLKKLASFLTESIERVKHCCPSGYMKTTDGESSNTSRLVDADILKIARGEDISANRYVNSSASSSSSSSPLQKQRYLDIRLFQNF